MPKSRGHSDLVCAFHFFSVFFRFSVCFRTRCFLSKTKNFTHQHNEFHPPPHHCQVPQSTICQLPTATYSPQLTATNHQNHNNHKGIDFWRTCRFFGSLLRASPLVSAKCLGMVVLPARMLMSLTFVSSSGRDSVM